MASPQHTFLGIPHIRLWLPWYEVVYNLLATKAIYITSQWLVYYYSNLYKQNNLTNSLPYIQSNHNTLVPPPECTTFISSIIFVLNQFYVHIKIHIHNIFTIWTSAFIRLDYMSNHPLCTPDQSGAYINWPHGPDWLLCTGLFHIMVLQKQWIK